MIDKTPPPPPAIERASRASHRNEAPIADVRNRFDRKTPQTAEDLARARSFIDGKIELVRRDRTLSDAQKAAAISDLKSKR